MINLIPPAHRQAIYYGRLNTRLVSWAIGIAFAFLGLIIIIGGSLFYLKQDSSQIRSSINKSRESLAIQNEKETLDRVKEINDNLKLTVDVLSNEVLFSELLQHIGLVMPPGTVLEDLSLTNEVFGLGINLQASARDYETGTRVHVNLNDSSNGIFEKADLVSITCEDGEQSSDYPCIVSVRALFMKDNPFLLIRKGGGN